MLKRNLIIAVIFISGLFAVQTLAQDATTQTFNNAAAITINDNGNASLYPSNISVSGVSSFTRMTVRLNGFSHTYPDDADIILVGPNGQRAILMSDAGAGPDVTNLNLTFAQTATTPIPDATALTTDTFRPTNYVNEGGVVTDNFPAPGPGLLTEAAADLFVFNGTNPNGIWNLYVVDDASGDTGSISGGWTLTFTVPQIFTVTNTNDAGAGSLREAITLAQDGDLINFSALFNTIQTINLLTALPDITRSITINGTGANLLTVRRDYNAATDFRIFNIPGGITNGVAISGMTITGGRAIGGFGGGINSLSNLTLTGVHVTGNSAGNGGGVGLGFADGVFTGCTFSGNTAGASGGGIFHQGDGGRTLRLVSSTVSGNSATNSGGGITNFTTGGNSNSRLEVVNSTIANNTGGGILTLTQNGAGNTATTTLRNSIIAGNTSNNLATQAGGGAATSQTLGFNLSDNFNGVFTPLGTDITSATPRLGALSLGGGTTPTHALLGGSPAIDAGNASASATDQRGVNRVFDTSSIPNVSDGADIGAVEMRPIIVSNINDANAGSLRQAISTANSLPDLDDIIFDIIFNTAQTINLLSALPNITSNLTINGAGANLLTVRRAAGAANFRIFNIVGGNLNSVAISGMTVTGGNAGDGATFGGGISSGSNLTLTNVHVTGNAAGIGGGVNLGANGVFTGCTFSLNTATFQGGAINYEGSGGRILRLINSTVSGNTTGGAGGGILNISTGGNNRLEVTNSTIANNTSASGGGIRTDAINGGANALTTLRNSIIAGNTPNNLVKANFSGGATEVTSFGFNLANDNGGGFLNVAPITTDKINANAELAALADNGGTVPTRALLSGSAALDAGNNSGSGVLTDQRGAGFNRTVNLLFVANAPFSDGTDIGAFEAQITPTAVRTRFDFDGDGKADVSVFRPSNGVWYLLQSQNGFSATAFGISTDKITPADYDGDGIAEICVFRPSDGTWYFYNLVTNQVSAYNFGISSDIPTAADYDGDGKADIGVFRPSVGTWYIQRSTLGFTASQFGQSGDKPVPADYDGDGKTDVAVYSSGTWYLLRSTLGFSGFAFGLSNDIPTAADYDGDGKADIAVFRPSDGTWYLQRSQLGFTGVAFGTNDDQPAPGAYLP